MAGTDQERAREVLEGNLFAFAKYINPHYCYGNIHEEVFGNLQDDEVENDLLLMPRAHLKSHCIAVWCVWQITRDPCSTIVYLSAGEDLATIQVSSIKHMITCERYRTLWPEMINREDSKREKWAAWGFNVDHPKRREMGIRDLTIIVKTVKGNAVGLHCSHLVFDDIVVPNNAYTSSGRRDVKLAVSQFASILSPGGLTKTVGTRYHPLDIYSEFQEAMVPIWVEDYYSKGKGEFIGEEKLWHTKEYIAESSNGDLTGEYLWPRTESPFDGKSYGFDAPSLAKIKAKYFSVGEQAQFHAQYYNDPNAQGSENVSRDSFQFYDKKNVGFSGGVCTHNGRRLNVYAAMDVAWTTHRTSDYTALAVIGVDTDNNIYVLHLDRFKTKDFSVYYDHVILAHREWSFRKLQVESNAGGAFVASELKRLLRENGASLTVVPKASTGSEGKKEEKHQAILYPRISNGGVFFCKGGLTDIAIEEIILERPPHDDLKDALTTAISISVAPARQSEVSNVVQLKFNKRFGGRVR